MRPRWSALRGRLLVRRRTQGAQGRGKRRAGRETRHRAPGAQFRCGHASREEGESRFTNVRQEPENKPGLRAQCMLPRLRKGRGRLLCHHQGPRRPWGPAPHRCCSELCQPCRRLLAGACWRLPAAELSACSAWRKAEPRICQPRQAPRTLRERAASGGPWQRGGTSSASRKAWQAGLCARCRLTCAAEEPIPQH